MGATDDWRRPVSAHAEESTGFTHGEFQRAITWYIDGEHQFEDAERMRKGLVCTECLSTFPAAPDKRNLSTWKKYADEWSGLRSREDVLQLVATNRCPTCSAQVASEMFALSYKGIDPYAAQPLKDIIDK